MQKVAFSKAAISEKSLEVAMRESGRALGDEIEEEKPLLDSRLPDGSRVAAVFPPCSVGALLWQSGSSGAGSSPQGNS